tara:strand:+ start:88 stop:999 length:912 start_codon:yes stop_codon:yes gene_type:complete
MAFNVTSNFAGTAAGFYISAALKASNSLDYLTIMENVKFKSNLQRMAGSNVVRNAECDFTDHGTLALTEQVITPKQLQINLDLCKDTLLQSWESLQMRAGAGAPPPASFDDYVISYMGDIIAQATENSIWNGAAATQGEFEGFLTAATGMFVVDGTTVPSAATGAYTAVNIIGEIQTAITDMIAGPTALLGKDDLYIYMSQKTYALYIQAVSTLGYVNAYNMNGDYVPVFEGHKIAACNGMADNQLVIAEKSNLYYATDLISDSTRIALLDMSSLDGSDNLRMVCKYSGGVQVGVGADVVWQQ